MKSLEELKKEILADGIIDAKEVAEIRKVLYADGRIDKEEADFLFELNDAVSGKNNDASWSALFVEALSNFVLDDDISNGAIDDNEASYLKHQIQGDGQIDDTEKALLMHLKEKLGSLPTILTELLA
jgi:uncharacterized membrane protein YebE (DUF533 family)